MLVMAVFRLSGLQVKGTLTAPQHLPGDHDTLSEVKEVSPSMQPGSGTSEPEYPPPAHYASGLLLHNLEPELGFAIYSVGHLPFKSLSFFLGKTEDNLVKGL
jgi:hypothetical protein